LPSVEGFFEYDLRVGTVIRAEEFPEARKPTLKLWIDFGLELGEKTSAAQITDLYGAEDLAGSQVVAVVNFPSRKIGPFSSEVLVLGVETEDGVVILRPDSQVDAGSRVF
jgi:tRNA-binding protein